MKSRTSIYGLLGLLLIALGGIWFFHAWKAQAPAQVFPATVDRDCAPWDGEAFTVSIPWSDTSTMSISIYRSPDIKLPSSYSFSDETMSEGHTYLLLPDGLPEQLAGRVWFQRVEAGLPVEGRFQFRTEAGVEFEGQFVAEWGDEIVYCG